jgi:PKD repeat protein
MSRFSCGITLGFVTLALVYCGDDAVGPSNPNPSPNPSPIAAFGPECRLLACTFTDSSTDDEALTAWRWDFGDSTEASSEQNPVHAYAAEGQYRVTLTVRDNDGAVTSLSQDVAVTPTPACGSADGPDDIIPCYILIPGGYALSGMISSESDCTGAGDTLRILGGTNEDIFTDGCHAPKDVPIATNGGNPYVSSPTNLYIAMILQSDDPDRVAPSAQAEGGFPEWHVRLDDGGHAKSANEPDFNDLVITFRATLPSPWDYLRQFTSDL